MPGVCKSLLRVAGADVQRSCVGLQEDVVPALFQPCALGAWWYQKWRCVEFCVHAAWRHNAHGVWRSQQCCCVLSCTPFALPNERSSSSHDWGCMAGLLSVLYVCVFGAEDVARPSFVAVSAVCVQKLAAFVVLRTAPVWFRGCLLSCILVFMPTAAF